MRPSVLLLLLGSWLVACDACSRDSTSSSPSTSPAPSTSPSPSTLASSDLPPVPPPPLPAPLCRVMGPTPPTTPSPMGDFNWLEVASATRMTAKDPKSARETGFEGPARVRICVQGEEESWIVPGLAADGGGVGAAVFASVRGAGEAPGAEEWAVTPLGIVRYSAAMVRVTTTPTRASIELTSGTIDVWSADDAVAKPAKLPGDAGAGWADGGRPAVRPDEGWQRYDGSAAAIITAAASTLTEAAAKASVERCVAAGAKAQSLAAAIFAPDASLGTLAPQHVVARRLARAACAVARVRASALPSSAAAAALAKAAADADAVWRQLR